MKTVLVLTCVCLLSVITVNSQSAKDYAIRLQATVSENPPSITLTWPADTSQHGYQVFRKSITTSTWGAKRISLPASATSFTDTAVKTGDAYEYYVQRMHDTSEKVAHGYIYAGIKHKPNYRRGLLCLLVDQHYALPLQTEITEMVQDLKKDGWAVVKKEISRTTTVDEVKAIIRTINDEAQTHTPLNAVLLLGKIAVPYSGGFVAEDGKIYPPDGHNDHGGAWPTDLYYASLDENIWTDNLVDDASPVRTQNQNIPGDGKFDLMYLEDNQLSFEIGRVDVSNLPAFGLSDTLLMKRYLNKLHAYKTAQSPVHRAAIIDDNFGAADDEAFAASAWNDFTTFFGDGISEQDYVLATREKPYLFSYGCGFGNYSTCFGVVNSSQFANDSIQQYFTLLFGSYFGDWDSENNLLRSALASAKGGLAAGWSGRPYWRLHPMALGKSIGYCARLTQQNYFNDGNQPSGYASGSYPTFIHINLLGDPTLRLSIPQPLTHLTATSAPDSISITLNWVAVPNVVGYHIATGYSGDDFPASIEVDASQTSWTDENPLHGNNVYLVRPIYLEQTPSGSYYNLALGAIDSAYSSNTTSAQHEPGKLQTSLFPNPVSADLFITVANTTSYEVSILDVFGRLQIQQYFFSVQNQLSVSSLPKGYYFVRITSGNQTTIHKIIKY